MDSNLTDEKDGSLDAFVEERNNTLASLDRGRIEAFYRKWNVPIPSDEVTFWAAVHKAITAVKAIPREKRLASKEWLASRGFSSLDDGDLS